MFKVISLLHEHWKPRLTWSHNQYHWLGDYCCCLMYVTGCNSLVLVSNSLISILKNVRIDQSAENDRIYNSMNTPNWLGTFPFAQCFKKNSQFKCKLTNLLQVHWSLCISPWGPSDGLAICNSVRTQTRPSPRNTLYQWLKLVHVSASKPSGLIHHSNFIVNIAAFR